MKLLIIDDDSVCTLITTWAAKNAGIFKDIQSVASGREALGILEQVRHGSATAPDIILLDLNMPVMDGFDFMEQVNELSFPEKKRISIIILSSSDNPKDVRRAKALGVEHYLLKSLSPTDLQRNLISLSRKRKANASCHRENLAADEAAAA